MRISHGWKGVATVLGLGLCGVEVWMNAEHIAQTEGWASSIVVGTIAASVCAAAALPLAERAWKDEQTGKAIGLVTFFLLMAGFALGASAERTGGKADGDASAARAGNVRAELAMEAVAAAKKAERDECAKVVGTACRKARQTLVTARERAMTAPATKVVSSGAERIAALTGIPKDQIVLYHPLTLALAFQIGGFILLAYGLAPAKPEPDIWAEPPAEAEVIRITSEDEAYRWLIAQILSAPKRKLQRSGRSMATEIGIAPSTFAKWAEKWQRDGKANRTVIGNDVVWTLPKLRRAA